MPPEPTKKDRILDAAARVLSEQGVKAFNHRSVAVEADVPLGLTTYYFKNKNDLLVESIRRARNASMAQNSRVIHDLIEEAGLAAGLANYLEYETSKRLGDLTKNYRVYLSALYQPELQKEVETWHPGRELASYVDEPIATMLGLMIEGVLIHAVVNQRSFTALDVRPAIDRLLADG